MEPKKVIRNKRIAAVIFFVGAVLVFLFYNISGYALVIYGCSIPMEKEELGGLFILLGLAILFNANVQAQEEKRKKEEEEKRKLEVKEND